MRTILAICGWAVAASLASGAAPAWADAGARTVRAPAAISMAAYPPAISRQQVLTVSGRAFRYRVTVGALPVHDTSGAEIGAVTYTAYQLAAPGAGERPVTFAMNGGPGAASAMINMEALGPQRAVFRNGSSQSLALADNADSWLPFTDLVFVDPIGTGFSRSFLPEAESQAAFYSYDTDIAYLSRFIYDWLAAAGRLGSPKYLVGESYSGYRAPRIVEFLQEELKTPFDGLVLLSPLMNQDQSKQIDTLPSPMPWIGTLPSAAAAELERRGQLTPQALAPIEAYARTDYAAALLAGWRDPALMSRTVDTVAALTGVSKAYLSETGGRIEPHSYLREIFRPTGRLANYFDVTQPYPNPFPTPNDDQTFFQAYEDGTTPQPGPAMADFVTRTIGWRPPVSYLAGSEDVNRAWRWARGTSDNESYSTLRRLLATNVSLKVLIVHGFTDIACPYFADVLAIDQIPPAVRGGRLTLKTYPGGHMFYSRAASLSAFSRDAHDLLFGDRAPAGR